MKKKKKNEPKKVNFGFVEYTELTVLQVSSISIDAKITVYAFYLFEEMKLSRSRAMYLEAKHRIEVDNSDYYFHFKLHRKCEISDQ